MRHHPMPCGSDYTPSRTIFRLWAPHAEGVFLQRFNRGSDEEAGARFLGENVMERQEKGYFTLRLPGNLKNQYYQYRVLSADGSEVITADPWALACGINGHRSMVVDLDETNPVGWQEDSRLSPAKCAPSVWEVHVGDFSSDPKSGIPARDRGKYTAFCHKNTILENKGKFPTCLNYLRQLGVTHVQLQPIFDFCTVDESGGNGYNWGYDPENYNIPEGSFATDPYHGAVRIRECKQMIQALHRAGIRVVMDVVYNHTYRKNSPLQATAPGEYYRYMPDGSWSNASGCGTETASERDPFRQFMIESVLYWAEEYHIDGFRFDLMAIHDMATMNLLRHRLNLLPNGRHILLYGEPWSALPTRMQSGSLPASKHNLRRLGGIGSFSDDTRDALVGSTFDPLACGYVTGKTDEATRIRSAVKGWCDPSFGGYARNSGQILQYVSCHDNYTLWDKLTLWAGKTDFFTEDEARIQLCRLASGICMTARGISFFQAGEEFGRSKDGNDNTYLGPAVLNRLDWSRASRMMPLVEWYRGLLGLRRHILPTATLTAASAHRIRFLEVPEGCVGYRYRVSGRWKQVVVYYQPHDDERIVQLPTGQWQLLVDGKRSNLWKSRKPKTVSGSYTLPAKSVVVLGQKRLL